MPITLKVDLIGSDAEVDFNCADVGFIELLQFLHLMNKVSENLIVKAAEQQGVNLQVTRHEK